MVSYQQKKDMAGFLTQRIEESRRYDIKESDNSHILLTQKPGSAREDVLLCLFLFNRKGKQDYRNIFFDARSTAERTGRTLCTSEVFYKDGKTFHVRLGARGQKKLQKSLKRYTKQEVDMMLHLRELEKAALRGRSDLIPYYQPETARLEESIRWYEMQDARQDYSHIRPFDQSYPFADEGTFIDIKIASEVAAMQEGPVQWVPNGANRLLLMPGKRNSKRDASKQFK
ncbi:hypothetical protein GF351_06165 [Candidatus Woesearchaeota archaeon]|nr:hypothetical protein [Candidatus Woesearchaeota archaeon]